MEKQSNKAAEPAVRIKAHRMLPEVEDAPNTTLGMGYAPSSMPDEEVRADVARQLNFNPDNVTIGERGNSEITDESPLYMAEMDFISFSAIHEAANKAPRNPAFDKNVIS